MSERGPGAPAGNENALRHGGERSIEDLRHGRPLRGAVAELAKQTAQELAADGPIEFLWQRTIDHAAVARLYLNLALNEDDPITLDTWVKRFGWLNDKVFRMVRDLVKLEQQNQDGGAIDYEQILAERVKQNGNQDR